MAGRCYAPRRSYCTSCPNTPKLVKLEGMTRFRAIAKLFFVTSAIGKSFLSYLAASALFALTWLLNNI
jgi:uncharacterized OB-fold protein